MNANIAAIAYLISGVLFILALRGLSSPVTSRRGNQLGMIGMTLAVGVTVWTLLHAGARSHSDHHRPDPGVASIHRRRLSARSSPGGCR